MFKSENSCNWQENECEANNNPETDSIDNEIVNHENSDHVLIDNENVTDEIVSNESTHQEINNSEDETLEETDNSEDETLSTLSPSVSTGETFTSSTTLPSTITQIIQSTTRTTEKIPTSTSTITTTPTTTISLPDKTCGSESLSNTNGKWFCNQDVVQKGTLCELKCYAGFFPSDHKMKRRCICTKNGKCKWNHVDIGCLTTPPPEPIIVDDPPTCTVLESNLNTGYWDCSKQNKNGSRCSLLCFAGYEQKRTNRRCHCKGDSCKWKGPDRQCIASSVFTTPPPTYNEVCETVLSDEYGEWSCTDENNSNSKCKLKCPSGYRLSAGGGATRRCRCQA